MLIAHQAGISARCRFWSEHSKRVHAQNAGDVLNEMEPREQASYIAGVIEGLAFSRFLNERPDTTGMQCIYDWYYQSETDRWPSIEQWFGRHPDRPVGAMLHVLIGRDCGS